MSNEQAGEDIAKKYCEIHGFECLFFNSTDFSFGYYDKTHDMFVHKHIEDLVDEFGGYKHG